jgi:IPT/TIG domain
VVSDTSITADSPAGTGTVDVTVTTPAGTSATSTADQFTYTAVAAPTVTGLSPTTGPATGGTLVTITGTSFTGATAVDFGTTPATNVTVVNDTTITADTPAGTGLVNVTVTTPAGTSATSTADQFTFAAVGAPTVVSLVRFGFHMQPTTLVLTFSSALDATSAQNINNYQILTSSGTAIPISSAVYDPATLTVTLSPSQRLSLQSFYQLTVIGTPPTGLTSATGVPIDGAGNGTSGTNFVMTFSGGILAGPAPTLLSTDAARFALEQKKMAAVDKRAAAVPDEATVIRRKLAAAEKRMAAATQKLAVKAAHGGSSAASAIDDVLSSGTVNVKQITAKRRSAARNAHQ